MESKTYVRLLAILVLTLSLFGCIRPEAPNAEADIVEVKFDGIKPLRAPTITNNTIVVWVNTWEDITSITPNFTLTDGATISPANGVAQNFSKPVIYKVTSQDGEWTKKYTVSIKSPENTPEKYSFEDVTKQGEIYHVFIQPDEDGKIIPQWESSNLGYAVIHSNFPAESFPISQFADGYIGKCAKLTTLSTDKVGATFGAPLATGSLFLGRLDLGTLLGSPLKGTQFGIPVNKKPLAITGYYKYQPGEKVTDKDNKVVEGATDSFDMYAMLYEVTDELQYLDGTNAKNHPNIVLMAQIKDPKATDEWTKFTLEFEPQNGKTVDPVKLANNGYNFSIVLSSSKEGAQFKGAVGSTLYVDEINVFYEQPDSPKEQDK